MLQLAFRWAASFTRSGRSVVLVRPAGVTFETPGCQLQRLSLNGVLGKPGWKLTGFHRAADSSLSVEQREEAVKQRAEPLEGLGTPPNSISGLEYYSPLGTSGLELPPRARGTFAF